MSIAILSFFTGLALGSIPSAFIAVRIARGLDIRKAGSGNVGALNSFLVTKSPLIGLAVLVSDVLKGVLAVVLPGLLFGRTFPVLATGCVGAVLGHNFPPWLGGKGGRGLATAAGALLTIVPIAVPLWILFWGVSFLIVRDVNVGSAIASCTATIVMLLLPSDMKTVFSGVQAGNGELNVLFALVMVVVLMKLVRPVLEYFHIQMRL
jgi:glycerol-3-phosphate acyltransferase PlsY